ncbi:Phosphoribosylglycinamide formyltransferase [Candidatus Norongarragalina meridionalis]|nr:Phosphoribosylglycinamide formyltransferase [Candidatus Norongarragalina meridionalis]
MLKVGVLASGRGSNLQAILDECAAGRIPAKVVVVISDKEGAPALERGRKASAEALFISPKGLKREEYDAKLVAEMRKHGVGLVVLAGYMRLISPLFVKAFRNKIINIHPALLPSFPGTHGQRDALEWGAKISGCTVHFVDEECDHGPIILQKAVPVMDDDTVETLSARILEQEHKALPEAIRLFAEGKLRVEGRRAFRK